MRKAVFGVVAVLVSLFCSPAANAKSHSAVVKYTDMPFIATRDAIVNGTTGHCNSRGPCILSATITADELDGTDHLVTTGKLPQHSPGNLATLSGSGWGRVNSKAGDEVIQAEEPSSLMLLGSGLIAVATFLRKRNPQQP